MKIVKLGLISVVVFGLLLWSITLMFPSNTVISRAINIAGSADSLVKKFRTNEISVQSLLSPGNRDLVVQAADIPFYEDNLFNQGAGVVLPHADTMFFRVLANNKSVAEGGIAFYQLAADSATTQFYYVFQTPWYKPLEKMKMMVADKAYGPGLDSALLRLKQMAQ